TNRSRQSARSPRSWTASSRRSFLVSTAPSNRRQSSSHMNLPPVILASASPRRAELLRKIVRHFEVLPGHAEESQPNHLSPAEACMLNAYHKARVLAKRFPDAL